VDFSKFKPIERKHFLFKCNRCGRETVFVVKIAFKDDEPVALGDGRIKKRCGGTYVFVKQVERT